MKLNKCNSKRKNKSKMLLNLYIKLFIINILFISINNIKFKLNDNNIIKNNIDKETNFIIDFKFQNQKLDLDKDSNIFTNTNSNTNTKSEIKYRVKNKLQSNSSNLESNNFNLNFNNFTNEKIINSTKANANTNAIAKTKEENKDNSTDNKKFDNNFIDDFDNNKTEDDNLKVLIIDNNNAVEMIIQPITEIDLILTNSTKSK